MQSSQVKLRYLKHLNKLGESLLFIGSLALLIGLIFAFQFILPNSNRGTIIDLSEYSPYADPPDTAVSIAQPSLSSECLKMPESERCFSKPTFEQIWASRLNSRGIDYFKKLAQIKDLNLWFAFRYSPEALKNFSRKGADSIGIESSGEATLVWIDGKLTKPYRDAPRFPFLRFIETYFVNPDRLNKGQPLEVIVYIKKPSVSEPIIAPDMSAPGSDGLESLSITKSSEIIRHQTMIYRAGIPGIIGVICFIFGCFCLFGGELFEPESEKRQTKKSKFEEKKYKSGTKVLLISQGEDSRLPLYERALDPLLSSKNIYRVIIREEAKTAVVIIKFVAKKSSQRELPAELDEEPLAHALWKEAQLEKIFIEISIATRANLVAEFFGSPIILIFGALILAFSLYVYSAFGNYVN